MSPTDPDLLAKAKELRSHQTDAEWKLWRVLRGKRWKGMKWRRQVPIAGFIVDFYCEALSLVVEVDGGQHGVEEEQRRDERRTGRLKKAGMDVVRFWNHEVLRNLPGVVEALERAVEKRKEERLF